MHNDLDPQAAAPAVPGETETAPDAGAQPSFEALLEANPHYRQAHNERVRKAVEGRLRNQREAQARLEPLLEALHSRYGSCDTEELIRALAQDRPVKSRKEAVEDFRGQVAATRKRFPAFRLEREMRSPAFGRLVAKGVPMEEAYRLAHQDKALMAAMGYAIRRTRQALADGLMAGTRRPGENALGGRTSVPSRPDPRRLTGQQRKELKARVARGEKVYW